MRENKKYYVEGTENADGWNEKNLELKMMKPINEIYKKLFDGVNIWRPKDNTIDGHYAYLDKHHGIDTWLLLSNGSKLTVQEKVLRSSKQKYNHLTWEYLNDKNVDAKDANFKQKGEWFKGMANLYFFAYANEEETQIERWYVLDITRLKTRFSLDFNGSITGSCFINENPYPAYANFLCWKWDFIEKHYADCILFSSAGHGIKKIWE